MKKQKFNKYSGFLSTAILLIAAACLIAIITLCVSGARPDIWNNGPPASENTAQDGRSSRLERTPDYGQNYIDSIIFVGDTTISALAESGALDADTGRLQVWSGAYKSLPLDYSIDKSEIIYPETNDGLTVAEAAALKMPEYIIITVGAENGVAYCGEEKFKSYYSKLIDALSEASPRSKIMLQSLFPVSDAYEEKTPAVTNEKIDRANLWIEELAKEKELRYLDTSSALKNSNGTLDAKYDSGDGLHLNQNGYLRVIEYIRTHGYK